MKINKGFRKLRKIYYISKSRYLKEQDSGIVLSFTLIMAGLLVFVYGLLTIFYN